MDSSLHPYCQVILNEIHKMLHLCSSVLSLLVLVKSSQSNTAASFEKGTPLGGVRDNPLPGPARVCSSTITQALTEIFMLHNGAMKSCSTQHNCSL